MRVVLLLLLTLLAGCADPETIEEGTDDTFDDVDVTVSDETGAILGVVINDAIVPVAGARVVLTGADLETLTDAEGRFSFSDLTPGTYFLEVSKELHTATQTSTTVEAGVAKPDIVKVRLIRMYSGEPYLVTIPNDGFFTCTQDGAWPVFGYSSSPCHSNGWTGTDTCDDYGQCLPQQRDFHSDVGPGWLTQVWEMKWEPSAYGTSPGMGIVVSTYKPERDGGHWFAEFEGFQSPLYGRLECNPTESGACTAAPSASGVEPSAVPSDGIKDMSYFMSVRSDSIAPAFAIDQEFQVWLSQSYYGPLPEEWSFINGSPSPF